MSTIEVLDPSGLPVGTGKSGVRPAGQAPRLQTLDGEHVAFLDNTKLGAAPLLATLRERFERDYRVATSAWAKTGQMGQAGPMECGELIVEQASAVVNAVAD